MQFSFVEAIEIQAHFAKELCYQSIYVGEFPLNQFPNVNELLDRCKTVGLEKEWKLTNVGAIMIIKKGSSATKNNFNLAHL